MHRNPFAPLPLLLMLLLLAVGFQARAACTAGNPSASVIESTPTSDFTDNLDGTVTHAKTGLMWKQCAEGLGGASCSIGAATMMNWANALNAANTTAFAGYTDWRLPNKKELESIVELCGFSPSINLMAFPATPASGFWSGSSSVWGPVGPAGAWAVYFDVGGVAAGIKTFDVYVRLVRGGQSVDSFDLLRPFSVTYDGNTQTGGSVPTDGNSYATGDTVTVLANSGSLTRTGYTFAGWNTQAGGGGTSYAASGSATFTMGSANVTLYAQWTLIAVRSYTGPSATGTGSITASFTGGGAGCGYTVSQFIPLTGDPASPPAGSAPAGVSFLQGLFHFTTSGCAAGGTLNFTIVYPQVLPSGTQYWKYGPTAGDVAPHWYVLPATIAGNTVTFSITDGGLGDDDLTANGTIVDQGGPGAGATGIPTLSEWAMVMLMLLLGLMGARSMKEVKEGDAILPPGSA